MSRSAFAVLSFLLCALFYFTGTQAAQAQSCSASVISTVNANLDLPLAGGDDVLEIDFDDDGSVICSAQIGNANTAFNDRMEVSHCSTLAPTDLCFVVDRAAALTAASISGPGLIGAVSPADDAEVDLSAGTYDVSATLNGAPVGFSFTILENGPDDQRILAVDFPILIGTPEINLSSSTNGPLTDDGVDAQGAQPAGVAQTITYTINNTGPGDLTLTGTPTIAAETNIQGAVVVSPLGSSTVAAGATTTFTVNYTPELAGPFAFEIDVGSDDADEGTFDISVSGTATGDPDILVVSSESGPLADGGTDTQGTLNAGETRTVTYTITNGGADTLTLSGTPVAGNATNIDGAISVTAPVSSSLSPGDTTTFDATYTTLEDGPFSFDIAIESDDPDTGTFDIAVDGTSNAGPSVVLTSSGNPQTGPFVVTATFSEPVSDVALADFVLANGTVSDLIAVSASVYTVLVTAITPSDAVSISLPAGAATDTDGAPNSASSVLTVASGVLSIAQQRAVRDAVIQQTTDVLRSTLAFNQRANRDARDRFVEAQLCRQNRDGGTSEPGQLSAAACGNAWRGWGAVPFQFNADVEATRSGIDALGDFFVQSPSVGGGHRLIFGEFAAQQDNEGNVTGTFNGRVAWEYPHGNELLVGYFIGANATRSELSGTLPGTGDSRGLAAGTYFVGELDRNLYWDGFAAVGIGSNRLDLHDDVFEVSSDYTSQSIQLGMALSGRKDFDNFWINPELSVVYGASDIGDIDLDVQTVGATNQEEIDVGRVEVGSFRFRPEFVFPDQFLDGAEWRVAPSLACEYTRNNTTERDCGGALEVEWTLTADDGSHAISARASREVVGTRTQTGLSLQVGLKF